MHTAWTRRLHTTCLTRLPCALCKEKQKSCSSVFVRFVNSQLTQETFYASTNKFNVAKCNLGEVKLKPMLPAVFLICASNLWGEPPWNLQGRITCAWL